MNYLDAGFDQYLSRSIENTGQVAQQSNQLNFDYAQIGGSLGDHLRIGSIDLDGASGRISIFDENGNEAVRIGQL